MALSTTLVRSVGEGNILGDVSCLVSSPQTGTLPASTVTASVKRAARENRFRKLERLAGPMNFRDNRAPDVSQSGVMESLEDVDAEGDAPPEDFDEEEAWEAVRRRMREAMSAHSAAALGEIGRARSLRAESLTRMASIRALKEEADEARARRERDRADAAHRGIEPGSPGDDPQAGPRLHDLPDDVLSAIMSALPDPRSLCALSLAFRRAWHVCRGHTAAWAALCRDDYGIPVDVVRPWDVPCRHSLANLGEAFCPARPFTRPAETAAAARRRETRLREEQARADEAAAQAREGGALAFPGLGAIAEGEEEEGEGGEGGTRSAGQQERAVEAGGVCRTWRDVYRDRHEGLGLALRVLAWLRQSHHPSDVSGRQHRDQLRLALAYLCMATVPTHGGQPRTRQEDALHAVDALVPLLESKHGFVQELAAAALANLTGGSPAVLEAARQVTGQGRALVPKLSSAVAGVVREASRALANLWAPRVRAATLAGVAREAGLVRVGAGVAGEAGGGTAARSLAADGGEERPLDVGRARAQALRGVMEGIGPRGGLPHVLVGTLGPWDPPEGPHVVQELSSRGEPAWGCLVMLAVGADSEGLPPGCVALRGEVLATSDDVARAGSRDEPPQAPDMGDGGAGDGWGRGGATVRWRAADDGVGVRGHCDPETGDVVLVLARPGAGAGRGHFGTRDAAGAWGVCSKCAVGDTSSPAGVPRHVFRMYRVT